MQNRKFHVVTTKSPEGIIYSYNRKNEQFAGLEIKEENMPGETLKLILANIRITLSEFLSWIKTVNAECVEMQIKLSFDMFWDKYNDKERSSKKRSQRIWEKLSEENQIKAYYYYDRYNRNRGSAEKKYCETYLSAEMWNN